MVGFREGSGQRLLDQHVHAGRADQAAATAACDSVGTATLTASTRPTSAPASVRACLVGGRDFGRARRVESTHQLDSRQAGEHTGVMPPEVPHPDNGDAEPSAHDAAPGARPTIAMPASSGRCQHGLAVEHQALPASSDRTAAPACRMAAIVGNPTTACQRTTRPGFGNLHDADTGPQPCPGDGGIGPLHVDRHDGLMPDRDRLADVEARNGVGHPVAELQIACLVGRRRPPGHGPGTGQKRLQDAVESTSSTLWSRITSATAAMMASAAPGPGDASAPTAPSGPTVAEDSCA
ncbi:MAG: hypothetical protein R2712_06575 [Vicinamibacterales bacterium]